METDGKIECNYTRNNNLTDSMQRPNVMQCTNVNKNLN